MPTHSTAWSSGDAITAARMNDINLDLDDKLEIDGGMRTGLTAKRVMITDASGAETTLSGTIGQVVGFDIDGDPVAVLALDIPGTAEKAIPEDDDLYVLSDTSDSGTLKHQTGKTMRKLGKKFGGDGSDGAINGTANITITGTSSTYIKKEYTSWAAASGGAKTLDITPTNCILHIKVKGNADFTGWTFNLSGKGGQGSIGVKRSTVRGDGGQDGLSTVSTVVGAPAPNCYDGTNFIAAHGEGGNSQKLGYRYTFATNASTVPAVYHELSPRLGIEALVAGGIYGVSCGSGGSGGSSTDVGDTTMAEGGDGGIGLIIEVAGNVTFGTFTINNNGTGGTAYAPFSTTRYGGGGGGGSVLFIYGGTTSGSPTVNVAGGTQASGNPGKNGEYAIISLDDIS